jgi:hypothetical protein
MEGGLIMAEPIYQLFLGKPTEAWYQLSEEERASLLSKSVKSLEEVGAKPLLMCMSLWSSEQWMFFGVEEFPDIEAVQKHTETLLGFDHYRYLESMSVLGTAWEPS